MKSRTKLSSSQIARGRILVFVKGLSWHTAATMVSANYETLRRVLDPDYRRHRNTLTRTRLQSLNPVAPPKPVTAPASARSVTAMLRQLRPEPLGTANPPRGKRKLAPPNVRAQKQPKVSEVTLDFTDPERIRRRAIAANEAFVTAMRVAILRRQENPFVGAVTAPSTERPRRVRIQTLGFMSSPAGMCAER